MASSLSYPPLWRNQKLPLNPVAHFCSFRSLCLRPSLSCRAARQLSVLKRIGVSVSTCVPEMRTVTSCSYFAETISTTGISLSDEERRFGDGNSCLDWKTDERVRRSCEAGTSLRVAVLVSGGVDSSVALRLLCDAGHSCTAFYLKIWFQEDFENFWSACPWEEDLSFAQAVCDKAGVELKVMHLTDAYWKRVVSESILEVRAGRTPNPDMLCNSRIKFGEFLERVKDDEFDRVASGHYARVMRLTNNNEKFAQLCLSADEAKDQTYFLSQLSQSQLSSLMFPLGELAKAEVRDIAEAMGLANKQRKDSQGICFLGKVKFSEFIARHLGEKEGFLLEAETGVVLGSHKGFWFFTIGQRQGICLSNGPWFVVSKDVENNVVFVSRKYFIEKKRRVFRVGSFNWASGSPPRSLANMFCKVRHGPQFYDCTVVFEVPDQWETNDTVTSELVADNDLTAVVSLSQDDQGLAPGQYAAFYHSGVCLGSGVIVGALGEDMAQNVSPQALEIARLCNSPDFLSKQTTAQNKKVRTVDNVREVQDEVKTGVKAVQEREAKAKSSVGRIWSSLLHLQRFFSWLQRP